MALLTRSLTTHEARSLQRLATTPTTPTRTLQRAAVVWYAAQGLRLHAIAATVGASETTVRVWLRRFNAAGLDGLTDRPRPGRPPLYRTAEIATICRVVRTEPRAQGVASNRWTLDLLVRYLRAERGITISRSRLASVLRNNGVRWFNAETEGARVADNANEAAALPPRWRTLHRAEL